MVDISGFKKWLSEQPADTPYNYTSPGDCALAQYLRSLGHERAWVGPLMFSTAEGAQLLPAGLDDALHNLKNGGEGRNFGDLSKRLERV